MSDMKRHAGKLKNTDKKVVVVYMQLPNDPTHCLIVDTDALPPAYHDELMNIVEHDGQNETVLANILGRRLLSYTGKDFMNSLHEAGFLQRVPISNVIMYPLPNRGIPLEEVVRLTGGTISDSSQQTEVQDPNEVPTRFEENRNVDANDLTHGIANNLIIEANMLISEAESKYRRAIEISPALEKTLSASFNKISPKKSEVVNETAENTSEPKARSRSKKVTAS